MAAIRTARTRRLGRGRERATRRRLSDAVDWSLLSAQGRVLFYIALCPGSSVAEISVALGLTQRAIWGIIRALRRAEMILLERNGRRHHYRVNLDAPLLHPTIKGFTLREVLGDLAGQSGGTRNENCASSD